MNTLPFHQKVFGLGLSKTGTSSLSEALNILGINTIHYPFDDVTYNELKDGNYKLSILQEYQGIVDIPVAPYYAQLDKNFPGSKFILTDRDLDGWLRSVEKHWELMMKWWHNFPEFKRFHEFISAAVYGAIAFNVDRYQFVYESHEKNVREYFKNRTGDFLVMDICAGEEWNVLCKFLNMPVPDLPFPHANEWMHKLMEATVEMKNIISPGETFILIDQEGFGENFSEGRNRIPFLEKNGKYFGLPANDQEAIAAFESLQSQKPKYVVVGWPCFWWLDHYKKFHERLEQYPCIVRNDRLIVYHLDKSL
jgi:hypothetical protein